MVMNFSKRFIFAKAMTRNSMHRPGKTSIILIWMLCALYLLFSVGIVKATHFCMGREASVTYFASGLHKCPCSLFAKEKDNCCKDEHELIKLEDSQKNLPAFSLSLPALTLLGEIYSQASISDHNDVASFEHSPADEQPPPKILFKIYCSYVFYDAKSIA
jgi:hypothetical protein